MKSSLDSVCHFRIEKNSYGIPIESLREIQEELEVTKIPGAPLFVSGFVNVRGQILLVLNLYKDSSKIHQSQNVLIFKDNISEPLGIAIDEVVDIFRVSRDKIHEVEKSDSTQYQSEYVSHLYEQDQEILSIINPELFIQAMTQEVKNFHSLNGSSTRKEAIK